MAETRLARPSSLREFMMQAGNVESIAQSWPVSLMPDKDARRAQAERVLRLACVAIAKTRALLEADPDTLLMAVRDSAELGLEIGGARQHAALVPYKGKVQFQPMYRGLVELAKRSGEVLNVEAGLVYAGDYIEYVRGFPPVFKHVPWAFRHDDARPAARGDTILCAYALFWLREAPIVNGSAMPKVEVVEKDDLDKIAKSSKARSTETPWHTWPEEMMKKTAIKRGCKTLRLSTDLAKAIERDNEIEGVIDAECTVISNSASKLQAGRHAVAAKKPVVPEADSQGTGSEKPELPADPVPAVAFDRAAAIAEIEKYVAAGGPDQPLDDFDEALERVGRTRENWRDAGDGVLDKILGNVRDLKAAKA